MATKIIPAQEILTCDICHGERGKGKTFNMSAFVHLCRHGLDYSGNAVGPGGFKWDLCDTCVMKLETMIRSQREVEKQ